MTPADAQQYQDESLRARFAANVGFPGPTGWTNRVYRKTIGQNAFCSIEYHPIKYHFSHLFHCK
jgi:hypothetical protein